MFKTSITGLDGLFKEGDIPRGSVILVTGIEGALKSTFIFKMISNYIAATGEHGLYASLEETRESHLRNMDSFGFKKPEKLHIFDYKDMRSDTMNEELDIVKVTEDMIDFYMEKFDNLTVFALDSLNAFSSISTVVNPRQYMYHFFSRLRDKNLTSFLIMETSSSDRHVFISSADEHAEYFLADGIIELGVIEARENVKRYIQIKKMRTASHSMEKHQVMAGKDGISILGSVY
ncbi:Circadian clock protein kinase KaiC [uncultured archaeon]|nr:Circadian clock protein kinase KaiC [uncultured archaeon]